MTSNEIATRDQVVYNLEPIIKIMDEYLGQDIPMDDAVLIYKLVSKSIDMLVDM